MNKILYISLLMITLSSCSLEKRLAKYCPLCPTETETVMEYRDTTIEVEVPGKTVKVIDSLYCDSLGNVYSLRLFEKEAENLELRTRLSGNKYITDCESDTVYVTETIPGINTTTTIEKKIKVPFLPWWAKAAAWLSGIVIFIVTLYFIYKLFIKK